MSIGGVGGNKEFLNAGTEAIQKGGPEVLDTVAAGIGEASKAGRLNDDSLQAFNQLPAAQLGGFETAEAGGLQPPADYFNEATKYGVGDANLVRDLNDPQFDVNQPLEKFTRNRELLTEFSPAISTEVEGVAATEGSGKSGDAALVDAFTQKQDQLDKDIDELLNLDTSTPEGKKRYFELQQEIQRLQEMMNLILALLQQAHEMRMQIIKNIGG